MSHQPHSQRPPGVSLANWRERPQNRWAFRNARELLPTARIRAAPVTAQQLPDAPFQDRPVPLENGTGSLAAFLRESETDELVVLKHGTAVLHWAGTDVDEPHLLFSVSKSITALLVGILAGEGRLDTDAPVTRYVPEMEQSTAYRTATVRHLLDMTVGLDFEEAYLDPDGAFARYRRATGWNPAAPDTDPGDLLSFLATLPASGDPHGERFFYASPNSDLLGIVAERAGRMSYASLLSDRLWRPLGAASDGYVTVDRRGAARAAGGVCATARDLARLGELVRRGGAAEGRQIVPAAFVADLWTGGDRRAWLARRDDASLMPEGRYRSQWYAPGDADDCLCAIGIHGQWIHINPRRGTVVVRLASQALPLDDALDRQTLGVLAALAAAV